MMEFTVNYGSVLTLINISTGRVPASMQYPTLAALLLTEEELRGIWKEYLKQRAAYRRNIKFVDPCDA